MICPYCHSDVREKFEAVEMMFGTREQFEYSQCCFCDSVYLSSSLDDFDISKHYPSNYYSYVSDQSSGGSIVKRFLRRCRGRYELGQLNPVGWILHLIKPGILPPLWGRYGMRHDMRVLDVGCGSGALLRQMAANGVDAAFGCDPYLKADVIDDEVTIFATSLDRITGQFEMIMFNHSFEHMLDPSRVLADARERQVGGNLCIIRCPTTTSDAFQEYRHHWVQLDPPRHISIPSREGMNILSRKCGYSLIETIDDSLGFQFWGSEQYIRNIPLWDKRSVFCENHVFTSEELTEFEERAASANAKGRGDQAVFVLRAD